MVVDSAAEVAQVQSAPIRWAAWFGDSDLDLTFPPGWRVAYCPPRDGPDIGDHGIAVAIEQPIGTPRLGEIAKGRKRPCIVVDDLSRPTPGARLIPPLLNELEHAGIPAQDVTILIGAANHRVLMLDDLRKKLGDLVVQSCTVRNHFSWARCQMVGTTSRGTPVEINEDLLASDLRVLVGSIVPHPYAGFSGGAKLVLPASASIESAAAFHQQAGAEGDGVGVIETVARLDAEEAAQMLGVDFIVNAIPTMHRGVAAVVSGDLVQAHRRGVSIAQGVYATSAPSSADICVLSAYPKDNEFLQFSTALGLLDSSPSPLVRPGGTVVVASACSEGQGFHSLFGPGMRRIDKPQPKAAQEYELVVFSPNLRDGDLEPEQRDAMKLFTTWTDTLAWLERKYPGRPSVSVFPCAVTQLVTEIDDDLHAE